jgi:hypothetical protein
LSSSALDERYGRTRANSRGARVIGITVAVVFALVLSAWVVWAALDGDSANIEFRDVAHEITDDTSVSVTWQVTAEPGSELSCAVEALNEGFTVVGWKIVDLPPSEQRTRVFTETLRTTELAVSGLIYRCWLE